jgi:chorismate synthase
MLVGILEGMPAGLRIEKEKIDEQLRRRQVGFGRGARQHIESDRVDILSGVRFGTTLGSPVCLSIENKDWPNWKERMDPVEGSDPVPVTVPRPGHADFAGAVKYAHQDIRNVLERASARETAMRVALGAVVRQLLEVFGIWIGSHVVRIHTAQTERTFRRLGERPPADASDAIRETAERADQSDVRCADPDAARDMKICIRNAMDLGDSVGGVFEIAALGVPAGLGSYAAWDRRLDAAIAASVMGIPGVKSVEIGLGIECADRLGSSVHDPFVPSDGRWPSRASNRAGGIEGGISNGNPILVRATMKPIPTLRTPLPSVDLKTGKSVPSFQERSDVCAVPAAAIVGEAMVAVEIGNALCQRLGGDSLETMRKNHDGL